MICPEHQSRDYVHEIIGYDHYTNVVIDVMYSESTTCFSAAG